MNRSNICCIFLNIYVILGSKLTICVNSPFNSGILRQWLIFFFFLLIYFPFFFQWTLVEKTKRLAIQWLRYQIQFKWSLQLNKNLYWNGMCIILIKQFANWHYYKRSCIVYFVPMHYFAFHLNLTIWTVPYFELCRVSFPCKY